MNCWEFKKCGREAGGDHVDEMGVCPAWPDHGTVCAHITGTLCDGSVQEDFVKKLLGCIYCDFFNCNHYDRKTAQKLLHENLQRKMPL